MRFKQEDYENFFYRFNGRKPTVEENKEITALLEYADELDPFLLLMVSSIKLQTQRDKQVADMERITNETSTKMQSIANTTVKKITEGIPTSLEWNKATAWATKLTETVDEVAQHLRKVVIGTCLCLAVIIVVMAALLLKVGYKTGYDAGIEHNWEPYHRFACGLIDKSRHDVKQTGNAIAARAIERSMLKEGCDLEPK